jgi:bis(5'-nucleosyl)-tetraphosphatase (symmetrical)
MWSYAEALSYAAEVERVIQGNGDVSYVDFFRQMYGNEPTGWREDLKGMDRLRVITNFFTRMRLLDPSLQMNFSHKGALEGAPAGLQPWYRMPVAARPSGKILFGHWAALEGYTGVADAIALDTGCVWGRTLTAYCVETGEFITQAALRTA